MEIRQLRYFAAVVEEGTVTGAARRLNMTQPPLTAQLNNLEQELGCQLFSHEGRRLRLTEAGHTLYERTCAILKLCDTTVSEMESFRTGTAGTLHLGVVSSVQETLFPQWLAEFSARFSQIQYDLHSANTYQLLEQLHGGQLELAIVRTPFSAPDLEVRYLRREFLVAAGTADFFTDVPGSIITLEQLSRKPLILYRRWETILRSRFEIIHVSPLIRCRGDDAQTTLSLAKHGMGVGLLPSSALSEPEEGSRPAHAALKIRRLDDPVFTTEIAIVCRSRKRLSRAAQLFWDQMVSMANVPERSPANSHRDP